MTSRFGLRSSLRTRSSLPQNVAMNILCQAWSALVSIVFVPLYIGLIGIEAYGLVGFIATLQTLAGLLDGGLSMTVNRELAALSTKPDSQQEMRDLVRTFGTLYWLVGIVIGALIGLLTPWMVRHWLTPEQLAPADLYIALWILAGGMMVQWPVTLYASAMTGMHHLARVGAVNAIVTTVRSVGAVLVLLHVSTKVQAFVAWNALLGGVHTLILGCLLAAMLPKTQARSRFRLGMVKRHWTFAAGLSLTSILGILLTQIDKLVLSRLLPLSQFGFYSVATSLAQALYRFILSITRAMFPRLTELLSAGDTERMKRVYHHGTQLLMLLLAPAATAALLYPEHILFLWTHDTHLCEEVAPLFQLLVLGTVLNGMTIMPISIQWAYRWTSLHLSISAISLIIMLPAVWFCARFAGGIGAAWCWVGLNGLYLAVIPVLTHRRILKGELQSWLRGDICGPMAAALCAGAIMRLVIPGPTQVGLLQMAFALGLAGLAAATATSLIREKVSHIFA